MVPIHEQGGEGLLVQPVQPILIFLASIPQSSKITRDDRITYNVMVQASPKLCTGEAVFSVRLKEGRGNGTEEETFTVKTVGGDK